MTQDARRLLEKTIESCDLENQLNLYFALRDHLCKQLGNQLRRENVKQIEAVGGAQSKAFMIALLPFIWRHLQEHSWGTHFTVLDVGPGAAYGSELLASLHHSDFLGYRLDVDTIDVVQDYKQLIHFRHRFIRKLLFANIFDNIEPYDIIICSHVIEHVDEPLSFVRRLQSLARQKVFVLAPFEEREDLMSVGHKNRFDSSFFDNFSEGKWHLLHSIAWGAFLQPRYAMFLLELPPLK